MLSSSFYYLYDLEIYEEKKIIIFDNIFNNNNNNIKYLVCKKKYELNSSLNKFLVFLIFVKIKFSIIINILNRYNINMFGNLLHNIVLSCNLFYLLFFILNIVANKTMST